MVKKISAIVALKKYVVFIAAFALIGVLMGSALLCFSNGDDSRQAFATLPEEGHLSFGEDPALGDVWRPESGTYNDFVQLVRKSNGIMDTAETAMTLWWEDMAVDNSPAGFVYLSGITLNRELQEFTYERCQALGLEYELVLALMWRESRFEVDAVGYNSNGTRDNGIMQINDVNKSWLSERYGVTDLMDPYQNIIAGTAMLAEYMETYQDETVALMAYNYGKAGMQQKVAQGITTSQHVKASLAQRDTFKEMIGNV